MTRGIRFATVPIILTLALLASRIAAVPALSDPVTGTIPESVTLSAPALYLALAPLFTMWDGISMLSMTRLKGFLAGLVILYLSWRLLRWASTSRRGFKRRRVFRRLARELGVLAAGFILLLVFLIAGALWHRPMLSLTGTSADYRVVDFHSHTNASHDVEGTFMEAFDLDANLRWHERAGFDAAFITDHNVPSQESRVVRRESRFWIQQSEDGSGESAETGLDSGVASREGAGRVTDGCPGIEVSAWRAHIVLLGDTLPVDRGKYNGSLQSLLQLLETSERTYGSLTVASLPEYRRNHWDRLDTMAKAGLDGFEIVNASPKANELTRAERDRVIKAARAYDKFVVGVSDSHGWGATSMVWNLVSVAPTTAPGAVCRAVLGRLRDGFEAVRVIERHRLRPEAWWPMALTPIGVVWETWRGMGWALTASWLLWIWLLWALAERRRRRL
jgi:hypothetical protein